MTTKEITITKTIYVSNDGTEFDTPERAAIHDIEGTLTPVYLVHARGATNLAVVEAYSTYNKAIKAIEDYDRFRIVKVYLDRRFEINKTIMEST